MHSAECDEGIPPESNTALMSHTPNLYLLVNICIARAHPIRVQSAFPMGGLGSYAFMIQRASAGLHDSNQKSAGLALNRAPQRS